MATPTRQPHLLVCTTICRLQHNSLSKR